CEKVLKHRVFARLALGTARETRRIPSSRFRTTDGLLSIDSSQPADAPVPAGPRLDPAGRLADGPHRLDAADGARRVGGADAVGAAAQAAHGALPGPIGR